MATSTFKLGQRR